MARGPSKLMTAEEAVTRFVSDGDVVWAGYNTVPYSLTHEIIRQRKKDLDVVGASIVATSTLLFLGGCANRCRTGYLSGALRPGAITEMMDRGELRWEDYSNQAIAIMLLAGALGIPFIPTKSFLGTDYLQEEYLNHPGGFLGDKKWQVMESPFDGEKVVLLPALRPDVVLAAAQRADEEGNIQGWGTFGDCRWALWAGKKVIVSVEEIVPTEVVRRDPNRTLVPGFRVSAVVHEPFGAHPGSMAGYYDQDRTLMGLQAQLVVNPEARRQFFDEWIYGVKDRREYITHYVERFGYQALDRLRARPSLQPIGTVDYAFIP